MSEPFISLEAWSAAFSLDTAIENYFLEYGLVRSKDTAAPIIEAMARTVQRAINESLEREARVNQSCSTVGGFPR